ELKIPDLTELDSTYYNLDPQKMWKLKSGTIVEKFIYKYARKLSHESCLHSFIINDVDKEANSLFSKEDWDEIFSFKVKRIPKIDKSIINLMKNTSYSNKEHFDLNYIHLAYSIMHTLWESDNDDSSKLEGWYQLNIWGEGMSMASSDRKNQENYGTNRKKIGRKGDGVFRLKGSRLEFGAIETRREWEGEHGKKYVKDSLKLCKMLHDMLIQLSKECNNDEKILRELQTIEILNKSARALNSFFEEFIVPQSSPIIGLGRTVKHQITSLIFKFYSMDQQMLISHLNDNVGSPNGYVCRIRCGQLMELPAITPKPTIQNFIDRACNPQSVEPDLALNLEIADLINQKKQNYPRDAAMHIVRLVNHRNPTVAWLALTLLDICVKNCGYPFHLQIATKEFLNELVRKFPEKSPAIPNPIQLKILEFIQEWKITICTTSRHKDDLVHINDMYRLLVYKGYIFPEIDDQSASVLIPKETLKSPEELEEEDRVAQAAVEPSDLAEANELMKIMSGYNQEAKPDYKKQANEELENIQQKAILLNDMLNNVKSSEETSKGDIFEELIQSCKTSQPKIQKMISEEEDSESIDRLLTLNDLINTVLTRYENILKGIFDQPKELNQQSILQPKAKEETKTEPEPEPQLGQIRITSNPTTTTSSSSSTNEPALYNSTSSNKGFSHRFNLKNQNNTTFVENFPLMSPTTITKQSL
ncbi:14880_t:CDS:10, partial [Entrophospora sp. SA101]